MIVNTVEYKFKRLTEFMLCLVFIGIKSSIFSINHYGFNDYILKYISELRSSCKRVRNVGLC